MALLSLPTEVLDKICDLLDDDEEYHALANLRLTCKETVQIPERYLFSTICLPAQMDSIDKLEQLSRHERLRDMVGRITLDAEPVFEDIGREEWNTMVDLYDSSAPSDGSDKFNLHIYHRALALARDNMNDHERTAAWYRYKAAADSQKLLAATDCGVLQRRLGLAMSRFENLEYLNCSAGQSSKYCFDEKESEEQMFRLSLLEALCCPNFGQIPHSRPLQMSTSGYAAAAVYAMLCHVPRPVTVEVWSLPWQFMERLSYLFRIYGLPPRLETLERLDITLLSTPYLSTARIQQAVTEFPSITRLAPNLRRFNYWLDSSLQGFCHKRPYLPLVPFVKNGSFSRLIAINLWGAKMTFSGFQAMLQCVAPGVQTLEIGNVCLHAGRWVDIFAFMRKLQMTSAKIVISGPLLDDDHDGGELVWDVECEHAGDETELCLWWKVQAWLAGKIHEAPLEGRDDGGRVQDWEDASDEDDCMSYGLYDME